MRDLLLRPGWWCEARVVHEDGRRAYRDACRATSAGHAAMWMRTDVRTLLPRLDAADAERAHRWLRADGAPRVFEATGDAGAVRFAWSVRRVLFLHARAGGP
ncbi:hypothetical protein ACWGJ2_25245 [Streptomyces sp. NPDC054796]